jgi:hypothetical protein
MNFCTKEHVTSYNLAISIGWNPKDIKVSYKGIRVRFKSKPYNHTSHYSYYWREFNYLDSNTIYNIAEVYDCFPSAIVEGNYFKAANNNKPTILEWECLLWSYQKNKWTRTTSINPKEAIALAIINRDT